MVHIQVFIMWSLLIPLAICFNIDFITSVFDAGCCLFMVL